MSEVVQFKLKRALAASQQCQSERDGKPRVDADGHEVLEVRAFLFFEEHRPLQGKVRSISKIVQSFSEGDDLEIVGLRADLYSAQGGGNGISFWADSIRPVSLNSSKPSPSSSAT